MKIKWGALVVDGRNKIGGHVASKNRAGAYLRTKVTPMNPRSSFQVNVRAVLATIAIAWRGLDATVRIAWNNATSSFSGTDIFGDLRHPTGFNLYQRLNNNLNQINVAPLTNPPLPGTVAVINTGVLSAAPAGAITVTFTNDPIFTADTMVVDATAAISQGRSFVKSEFRRIGTVLAIAAHVLDLSTLYDTKFGAVGAAGQKIFVRMKMINKTTGQAGVPVIYSAVIT